MIMEKKFIKVYTIVTNFAYLSETQIKNWFNDVF